MGQSEDILHKRIDDMLIASIRFHGKHEQARKHFETLYAQCKDVISGPGFSLYRYGTSPGPGTDIEVCFPVSRPVESGSLCRSGMLPDVGAADSKSALRVPVGRVCYPTFCEFELEAVGRLSIGGGG
jgi:hypothetical protein